MMKLNTNALYFTDQLKDSFSTLLDYPCTVVEAPMGYGKTTAVKHVLAAVEADIIWQRIYDQGAAEFWAGFCQALAGIDASCSGNLCKIGLPIDSLMKREVMSLLRTMSISGSVFLVIDDYHWVKSAEVDDFLELLVRNMPTDLHLIIMSRAAVFRNSYELQLKGIVKHIGTQALVFSPADIKEYYHLCGINISEAAQSQLYQRSEGWISALYLLALEYELHGSFEMNQSISELVYQTVYDPLDDECKLFLKTVSLFDEFTPEQAEYMWPENAGELLERLSACNAFIRRDLVSGRYTFHNIFSLCIREQFRQESVKTQQEIWRRMGVLYTREGKYLSAMKSFCQAGDFDGFLAALEDDRGESIFTEQKEMLTEYYKACPLAVKKNHPVAVLVYALVMINNFNEQVLYEDACREFLWCVDHNPWLTEDDREQLLGEYEMVQGISAFNDIIRMGEHFAKAARLLKRPPQSLATSNNWTCGSPSVLCLYYREAGRLQAMIESYRNTGNYTASTDGHGKGSKPVMEAEWHYYTGDFENAEILAYKAISEARAAEQLDIVLCGFFLLARLALIKGDFSQSQVLITQMRTEVKQTHAYPLVYTIELCDAYIYACLDQAKQIPTWLIDGEYTKKMLFPSIAFANIVCGKAMLCRGDDAKMLGMTGQFIEQAAVFPNILAIIYIEIYTAIANHRLFRSDAAGEALQRALDMAMPDHLILPFAENAQDLLPILHHFIQNEAYTEFISEIMRIKETYQQAVKTIKDKHFTVKTPQLSAREKEIALLVIEGLNNTEIGLALYISPNTVKHDLKIIFSKLGINSRVLLTRDMFD